ncbi:MAG: hypothetical protein R3F14_03535 [Polyangiaceae bacterium]
MAEPSFARPLLEGVRPHALPEHTFVSLVLEDSAPLVRVLSEHGATVRMEILHYEGQL